MNIELDGTIKHEGKKVKVHRQSRSNYLGKPVCGTIKKNEVVTLSIDGEVNCALCNEIESKQTTNTYYRTIMTRIPDQREGALA